jgi:hypothetical protein
MKNYVKLQPNDRATHLLIDLYYNIGSYNAFTGKQEARGYYLLIAPVKIKKNIVALEAFSGSKILLKEVSRKSSKAEKEARQEAAELLPHMVRRVCNAHGLTLEEAATIPE